MKRSYKTAGVSCVAALMATSALAEDITIKMAAPDWGPTRFMQEYADATYKAPSGNNVKLEIDFIPWPNFFDRVNASLNSGEQKYQMIVTDSQWLGTFIEGGHFMKLNDYIEADPELQSIMKDLHPALISGYSTYPNVSADDIKAAGYPHPDANYYGFPQFPDTYVTWYRKDLFCDEGEQAKFKEAYGSDLPCAEDDWDAITWDDWDNIGKHFRRSSGDALGAGTADDDFYGTAYMAAKPLDFSTLQINAFMWQYGGGIWDETQAPSGQALGVVNSDASVAGFQKYLDLLENSPPIAQTGQMGIFEIQDLFMQGKVAAIIDWVALAAPAVDPSVSKVHDKVGFAVMPGNNLNGEFVRYGNLGGQPFVLTTWNDEDVVKEALDVVKWWLSEEVQVEAVKAGGQSGLMSVMGSDEYDSLAPWNKAHKTMLEWQKDLWHVPEFFEMVTQQQEEFDKAITGQITAQEALDNIAEFQDELLRDAGRIE